MLDFRIDTFLCVCQTMNYTKAADVLHITQPAVTHHIQHLEETYGVKLFHYTGKRLQLTPAGHKLFHAATTMKHDVHHLHKELADLARQDDQLVFGATLTIGEFAMPAVLAAYLQSNPHTKIRMVVADTRDLLHRLDAGEIDFALVEGPFDRRAYDCLLYSQEPYVAVRGAAYTPTRDLHRLEDLTAERLLLREAGSGTREVLVRHLADRNLSLHDFPLAVEISSIGAIKALAQRGGGITFLYRLAVEQELAAGSLTEIPLEDFQITHDFSFLWRKNSLYASRYRAIYHAFRSAYIGHAESLPPYEPTEKTPPA